MRGMGCVTTVRRWVCPGRGFVMAETTAICAWKVCATFACNLQPAGHATHAWFRIIIGIVSTWAMASVSFPHTRVVECIANSSAGGWRAAHSAYQQFTFWWVLGSFGNRCRLQFGLRLGLCNFEVWFEFCKYHECSIKPEENVAI